MKKLLVFLTSVLLLLAVSTTALAATCPVYLNGEYLTEAETKGDVTFLPLRIVSESLNASVEWEPQESKITITKLSGGSLLLQVGSRTALETMVQLAEPYNKTEQREHQLSAAPFIKNGVTYVPLRFVAEALDADEVQWQPENQQVNINSNVLLPIKGDGVDLQYELTTGHILDGSKVLCLLPKFSASDRPPTISARRTANGNYLLNFDYTVSGAITTQERQLVWLSAQGEQVWSNEDRPWQTPLSEPFINGDKIWLGGDNFAYLIDDKAGTMLEIYPLKPLIQQAGLDKTVRFVWADDDYALIRSDDSTWWAVLYLQTGNAKRIDGSFLTDKIKEQANAILWEQIKDYPLREDASSDEEYISWFWRDLTQRQNQLDAHLALEFVGATENTLHFELKIFSENFAEKGSTPLSYQYK